MRSLEHCFDSEWKPPLVRELFAMRESFQSILAKYKGVASVAEEIRTHVGEAEDAVGLEEFLRNMSVEESLSLRREYWEVPLYLQELMGAVSQHFMKNQCRQSVLQLSGT